MEFSSALKLTGLDDYITPSQACIKPVESGIQGSSKNSTVTIQLEENGSYSEVHGDGSKVALKPAKITLNDCLACSGCITSAESVLITQQSVDEFFSVLENKLHDLKLVVSISPQAWASIATQYNTSGPSALAKLSALFKQLGAAAVLDISLSRDLSLVESCQEFVHRFTNRAEKQIPVIASSCPGWVCYAEKTQHAALPFLSSVKSPQQISGTLVKQLFAKRLGVQPANIYHVCLMPCFDKKLEASRDDFVEEVSNSREVDLVLTSAEILDLIARKNINFMQMQDEPIENLFGEVMSSGDMLDRLFGVHGSSGNFAKEVFIFAAHHIFGKDVKVLEASEDVEMEIHESSSTSSSPISCVWKQVRNSDFHELVLLDPQDSKTPLLKFARCYGFRNIQNIIRQLKSSKGCAYHYVEVMACPSGCINGGGQIRADESTKEAPKERLLKVQETYRTGQIERSPHGNPDVKRVYEEVISSAPYSESSCRLLHTSFHARTETLANPLSISW